MSAPVPAGAAPSPQGAAGAFTPPRPEPPESAPGLLRGLLAYRGDILRALPRLAYRRQVMSVRLLRRRVVIVNDPEVVREVFVARAEAYNRKSHFKEQALRPVIGESLFANHGTLWARRRPAVARLLHPGGVARFQPHFVEAGHWLDGRWAGAPDRVVDVAPDLAAATLRVMLRATFGPAVPEEEAEGIAAAFATYQARVNVIDLPHLLGLPGPLAGRQGVAARAAAATIRRRIGALLGMAVPPDGLLAGMREARGEDGTPLLDAAGLLDEVAMLLLAGSETAANALAWTLYLLAADPAAAARVREEAMAVLGAAEPQAARLPQLTEARAVLQEAMRLYPPVAVLARQAARADVIRRWPLRAGDTLLCIPWLLHRHEEIWEQPHAFRPERFRPENAKRIPRFAYLPFGVGPRVCAGAAFGLAEMTTLLAMLIRRFDLAPGPGAPPLPRFRLTLRPEGGMRLRLQPRPVG
ncbi:cytochrome P450 [Roseomonas sp. OT10]|uniref:cytochrome P450 n=1 Tax=Roseomonas cutis TaxID=2897332 RepID=UPI001E650F43|nr:cytochrome P450 [Roseomonas sp. OT10]UFN50338.1 cytochrome P450 [Roseomonas sp. OT10]